MTGSDVSDSDDVAGREPCEREGPLTTCAGYDGFRTFEAWATTSPEAAEELDARLLIRTARKHWYGVMGGHFELDATVAEGDDVKGTRGRAGRDRLRSR